MERWYRFLCDHSVGVIRALYLAPVLAVLTCNETILWAVLLACTAVSITYQVGNGAQWNRVRCKDCKHWGMEYKNQILNGKHPCDEVDRVTSPNDFCSFAEKRNK